MSPVTRDPRSEANFPRLVWSSLSSRTTTKARRALLSDGLGILRATDPGTDLGSSQTLAALRNRPSPFRLASLLEADRTRKLILQTCPDHVDDTIQPSHSLRSRSIELLGAQWTSWPPSWHSDPRNHIEWDPQKSGRTILDQYPDPVADPKFPWELGRFQFAQPLVQAWSLTDDSAWAEAYLELVKSWIEANPFPFGVHRASVMEVALRAFVWTHAILHFREAPCFDETFWRRWRASRRDHARYIQLCLEWEPLGNENYYLANILGLAGSAQGILDLLGSSAPNEMDSRFEREVELQTLEDGANFEGSTAYHQFVTEMFVWASATTDRVSPRYYARVASQLEYLAVFCREDVSIPRDGDDDSGRFLPLSPAGTEAILDAGFALIPDAPRRKHGDEPSPDLHWIGGKEALSRWRGGETPARTTGWRSLPHAGIHVLEDSGWHLIVAAGPTRCRIGGGHLHSDLLPVVAYEGGRKILLDPGTLGYAGSLEDRDELRRARVHSTVAPIGEEPRHLMAKFRTATAPIAYTCECDKRLDLEVKLTAGFFVHRNVCLDAELRLEIIDRIETRTSQGFETNFTLGPGTIESVTESAGSAQVVQRTAAGRLGLRCVANPPIEIDESSCKAASGYGRPLSAHCARLHCTPNAPVEVRSTLGFLSSKNRESRASLPKANFS